MPTHFERLAPVPTWIGGIFICLLAASGIAAIARSIPLSYGSASIVVAPDKQGVTLSWFEKALAKDPQTFLAIAPDAINRRFRGSCPECGVIESIHQIDRSGDAGRHTAVDAKVPRGDSGSAVAAHAFTGRLYITTVRLHDGSTTVFKEPTPRSWRTGSRVIVIGSSKASEN